MLELNSTEKDVTFFCMAWIERNPFEAKVSFPQVFVLQKELLGQFP